MENLSPTPAGPQAPGAIGTGSVESVVPRNLDLVLDIELPVWARFGQTDMPLHALARLGPGATIDLDRSPEDPVELLVNDTVVARGEVVVAGGYYGVRVTEVVGRPERVRSMNPPQS